MKDECIGESEKVQRRRLPEAEQGLLSATDRGVPRGVHLLRQGWQRLHRQGRTGRLSQVCRNC